MTDAHVSAAYTILSRALCIPTSKISLSFLKLTGGTEATGVHRVVAAYTDPAGRRRRYSTIIKHLRGRSRREAGIMQRLAARGDCRLLPHFIGSTDDDQGNTFLGIEQVRQASAWPWRSNKATANLLLELGAFHETNSQDVLDANPWDYETELISRAQEAGGMLHQARFNADLPGLAPYIRIVQRVIRELPRLRRMLLDEQPFGARFLHGDVHPGNALIRGNASEDPVLIDWGRARLGSPLEDVSSMLQSLRMYEPAALQRHDTLLAEYLAVIRDERRINDAARSAYWVAGACNALAGALAWHLRIATDHSRTGSQRANAYSAAKDWLRVIRRAHAWAL